MKNHAMKQSGFTLIEMAIVLVIIGLLLGGILKGQELIDNSKVKRVINDTQGVVAAYNGYVDRFRRIPGDDGPALVNLTGRGGSWATVTEFGNNNGALDVAQAQVFTGAGEGAAFWQHLKASGFLSGNPADAAADALPRNSFNGLIGIGRGVTGMTANIAVCVSQVPGKAARQIDTQLDDGLGNSGGIRATNSVVGTHTPPGAAFGPNYVDANVYTICLPV